jgi:hypothetical protein
LSSPNSQKSSLADAAIEMSGEKNMLLSCMEVWGVWSRSEGESGEDQRAQILE